MKKGFLLSLVFALATLAGGYWLGKQSAAKQVTPAQMISPNASAEGTPALPPEKPAPRTTTPATGSPDKLSLAEIKAKIIEFNSSLGRYGNSEQDLMKILASVDVSDIPAI